MKFIRRLGTLLAAGIAALVLAFSTRASFHGFDEAIQPPRAFDALTLDSKEPTWNR